MTGSAVLAAQVSSVVSTRSAQPAIAAAGIPGTISATNGQGGVAASAASSGAVSAQSGPGGIAGSDTPSVTAIALVALTISPILGVLTLDLTKANTFRASLNQSVTSVVLTGLPASGLSERVAVYVAQDAIGGRTISGWPGVRWSLGGAPTLSATPLSVDCIVLDVMDGGQTILGNLAGLAYL